MQKLPHLRLSVALALFCIFVVVATWGSMLPFVVAAARRVTERQNTELLSSRGSLAAAQLSGVIHSDWAELQGLAAYVRDGETADTLRMRFDTVKSVSGGYAWIGFMGTNGQVKVATDHVLEGDSVLERPWFQGGLNGPYAGGKHVSVQLQYALPREGAENLNLIDLAMPVRRDGAVIGVIATQINWNWVRNFLRGFGRDNDVDLVLVSRNGFILTGTSDIEGKRLALPSVLAASQGAGLTGTETWPDGRQYFVTVVPIPSYLGVPSFGWSLVVRQRADPAFAPARTLTRTILPLLLGLAVVLVILALAFGRFLARPLIRLAHAASELAFGHFEHPVPAERRYREAAMLAAELSRLQSALNSEPRAEAAADDKRHGVAAG